MTAEAREPLYRAATDAIVARHVADEAQLLAEHDARADAKVAVDAALAILKDVRQAGRRWRRR